MWRREANLTIATIQPVDPNAWCKMLKIKPERVQSRLSYIKYKETKNSMVAILNYWIQTCFSLFTKRSLRCWRAFNLFVPLIKVASESNYLVKGHTTLVILIQWWAMPCLQAVVPAVLISPEYAAAWYELLCNRDFLLPKGAGSARCRARHPMGA